MNGEDCAPDCEERDVCTETRVGHLMCGHCEEHDMPRHHCGCPR